MKKIIILFTTLLLLGSGGYFLWADTGDQNDPSSQKGNNNLLTDQLLKQITLSGKKISVEKTILQGDDKETQNLTEADFDLKEELRSTFQVIASDKKIKDYFIETLKNELGRSLRVSEFQLKDEFQSKSKLKHQKVILADHNISYLESILQSDSWLYNSKTHIKVWFDESGVYQKHEFTYRSALLGDWIHYDISIEAKRL